MTSTEQKALLLESKQGKVSLSTVPIPEPAEGQVLVKILSAGLNPVDWKIAKLGFFVEHFPAILGTDIAGEVVKLGPGVTSFKEGDKVFFQGTFQNDFAAFQQYALAHVNLMAKIPQNISEDEAASIPVAFTAAYVGLYNANPHGLGHVPPVKPEGRGKYAGTPLFIFGGASSVGQYAIQLAKLSGFAPIITTASLKHEAHLKSLGATHVLDRALSPSELDAEVRKIASTPVKVIFDSISSQDTQKTGVQLLAPGGQIGVVLPPYSTELDDDKKIWRVLGIKLLPHNVALLEELYSHFTELLQQELIKPNRVEVLPNGLVGIFDGLKRLEENGVSGVKLIARPQET